MARLTVALLQMAAHGNSQKANEAKGDHYCREAAALGADIALFPEMWNIGYTPPYEGAIASSSPFVEHFQELARQLDMAIAITYLERWNGPPRNTVSLFDSQGTLVFTYAKVHTCDFSMEALCTPGDSFPVRTLATRSGPVEVGAMICFDREFPESARLLMLGGAEVILTPNCCPLEQNRLGQFRARAFENMVGVAMANHAPPRANGHSVAFDGMAFTKDGVSRDTLIVEAGEDEEVVLATFDLSALRSYRQREVWGAAFRKPHCYSALVEPK